MKTGFGFFGKVIGLCGLAMFATSSPAMAATDCQFKVSKSSMYLYADCTTDQTFVVPDKVTFNGNFHTITVVDPAGGNFQGAVIAAAPGGTAKIYNVNIISNLQDVCGAPGSELVGILFDEAHGALDRVNVTMNRGVTSSCQEGVGVQVRSAVVPTPGGKPKKVGIKRSNVTFNQLAGVRASGFVNVPINNLNVTGYGPTESLAQYGIIFENGATGNVVKSAVINHIHLPMDEAPAAGILLHLAGKGVVIDQTSVRVNDRGVHAIGANTVTVSNNRVVDSTLDGIKFEDAPTLPVTNSKITGTESSKNLLNGIHLRENTAGGVSKTLLKSNLVTRNRANGILIEGVSNKVNTNTLDGTNRSADIRNNGYLTVFSKNVCSTRSGPGVDCGVSVP